MSLTDWPCGHPLTPDAVVDMNAGVLLCPICGKPPVGPDPWGIWPLVILLALLVGAAALICQLPLAGSPPDLPGGTPTTYGPPPVVHSVP